MNDLDESVLEEVTNEWKSMKKEDLIKELQMEFMYRKEMEEERRLKNLRNNVVLLRAKSDLALSELGIAIDELVQALEDRGYNARAIDEEVYNNNAYTYIY